MQLVSTIATSLLVAVAALSKMESVHALNMDAANVTEPIDIEFKEVAVTKFNTAIVATALSDKRNFRSVDMQPICAHDVTRVRQATVGKNVEFLIEVNGCSVKKQRGLCAEPVTCQLLPFEVYVVGPATTPGFDAVTAMTTQVSKGKAVKTPYVVQSIGILL